MAGENKNRSRWQGAKKGCLVYLRIGGGIIVGVIRAPNQDLKIYTAWRARGRPVHCLLKVFVWSWIPCNEGIFLFLELSIKSRNEGVRSATFSIIGHQMRNWEWKFCKMKQRGHKLVFFHQFWWKTEFYPVFRFSWAPQLLPHIFSLVLPLQLLYLLLNLVH
jgi:hypothetical protein